MIRETFDRIQEEARAKQLLIKREGVCALIFAKNEKLNSYTGFFYNIDPRYCFDEEAFLKRKTLAGPKSITKCYLYGRNDEEAVADEFTVHKNNAVCEVPGIFYNPLQPLGNMYLLP